MEPLLATCAGCGRAVPEDREPCPTCGATTRNISRSTEDSLTVQDSVDVKTGTSIHLPMMIAAENARDRCRSAATEGRDVLTDSMVSVLLAAVALEAAIHWVADEIDPSFRAAIQMQPIAVKWAEVVGRQGGTKPSTGSGLGQAVRSLAIDRDWIAHYPGKNRSTLSTPLARDRGQTAARAHFTSELATGAVSTATEALHAIGVYWASAGVASGAGSAFDATTETHMKRSRRREGTR